MIIEVDYNFLVINNITIKEYLLCYLLEKGNVNRIKKYDKIDPFTTEFLVNLEKKGFIKRKTIPKDLFPTINNIEVTEDFKNLIEVKDPFDELWNLYPKFTIRIDGNVSDLRGSKSRVKQKYEKLIRGKPLLHKKIIQSLKLEIEHRNTNDTMKWMKSLTNWLDGQGWEMIEEMAKNNKIATSNTKQSYGTNII